MRKKMLVAELFFLVCILGAATEGRAQLVARRISAATAATDLFQGTDAQGGIGDYYLSNGIIQAIVDDVGFQADVLAATAGTVRLPITSQFAASGGTLIDLGLVGKNNDQLDQVFQVVNFNAANPIFYLPASVALGNPSLPSILTSVTPTEAKLTVFGFVILPPASTPAVPTLPAVTEYSVRPGENFLRIKTTVTNAGSASLTLFSIVDVFLLGNNSMLPFAVFPGRGFNHPALDLTNPIPSTAIYPFVSAVGRVAPSDGLIDTVTMVPADEVSYTVLTPASVLFGVNSALLSAVGNVPNFVALAPGTNRSYERRVIVGERNDVASSADAAIAQLGAAFGFPTGVVQGQLVAPDGLPFRAGVVITQIDINPLLPGPQTLLTPITGNTSPLPLTHVRTNSDLDGKFELVLPLGIYQLQVFAEERLDLAPVLFVVVPGTTNTLSPITLSLAAKVQVTVVPPGPAKLTFKGELGAPDPNFGSPFRFSEGGVQISTGSAVSSPAGNVVFTATGQVEQILRPGTYTVYASRGLEQTVDSQTFTVGPGQTAQARLQVHRAIETSGFLSADFHIHGARSFDSSAPPRDRVISYAAEGVQVMVSSDHDFIFDYQPVIDSLGLNDRIIAMVGEEATTGGLPTTFGHFNAWPLPVVPGARRRGAPEDEFVQPNIIYDRFRALGADVVQLNHPESVTLGLLHVIGYDPSSAITTLPNAFLLNSAITSSGTRNIDFDTLEIYNGSLTTGLAIPEYLLSRQDWFSLLNQGILKAATANSDSHRIAVEHAGFPRTFVKSNATDLSLFNPKQFNERLKSFEAIGTSGPFIAVKIPQGTTKPGGLVVPPPAGPLSLRIRVQAAPWIPVEEVRIFTNGQLNQTIPVAPSTLPVRFADVVPLPVLTSDTYIVVEAGQTLPADPTVQPPSLGLMAIIEPGVASLGFTNPLFIDVNRNGQFDPPGVSAAAIDTSVLREAVRKKSRPEEHWESFWPKFRVTPEQAAEALRILSEEGRRRPGIPPQ